MISVCCRTELGASRLMAALIAGGSPAQLTGRKRKVFATSATLGEIERVATILKVGTWSAITDAGDEVESVDGEIVIAINARAKETP